MGTDRAPQQPPGGDWLELAVSRAAGAPPVEGNRLLLLRDGPANFPAWLEAIASARKYVYFEMYIFRNDRTGRMFADALAAKARQGVTVRLLHDWLGCFGVSGKIWRQLREAGVEVRAFNPFHVTSPFGWVSRDHRKTVSVDGRVSFVSGLCVADPWAGDPEQATPPWRDTGVQLEGPAVADVEHAFSRAWQTVGPPIPDGERVPRAEMAASGKTRLRVIGDEPGTVGLLRLDQTVAGAARETLWLTDAYFAAPPAYVQALRASAKDGVDVRLLIPGSSDIPALQPVSRAGFRSLLDAGIRIFEWRGPMLHAKTAVSDGRWSRVGSTNLNVASWLGNYELDVVLDDAPFAEQMEQMFLQDLENSTELVLAGRRMRSLEPRPRTTRIPGRLRGSAGRAAAGALRVGNTVGAALTARRIVEGGEKRMVLVGGLVLLALAILWAIFPRLVAIPVVALLGWVGLALLWRAFRLGRPQRPKGERVLPAPPSGASTTPQTSVERADVQG